MAKDAKGHGSEARSGHEHAIAVDTVKNPLKGQFLGGPSATEAESNLRGKFGYNDSEISKLKGGSADKAAAAALDTGHPKSGAVPVHDGASGPTPPAIGRWEYENIRKPAMASDAAHGRLNAWSQTPEVAKGARKQLRQARAQRTYARAQRSR